VVGAAIMWVFGSLVFLVPAVGIAFSLLQPAEGRKVVPAATRAV
jgi:hypothetical protein